MSNRIAMYRGDTCNVTVLVKTHDVNGQVIAQDLTGATANLLVRGKQTDADPVLSLAMEGPSSFVSTFQPLGWHNPAGLRVDAVDVADDVSTRLRSMTASALAYDIVTLGFLVPHVQEDHLAGSGAVSWLALEDWAAL